jgi:hypothetical protein
MPSGFRSAAMLLSLACAGRAARNLLRRIQRRTLVRRAERPGTQRDDADQPSVSSITGRRPTRASAIAFIARSVLQSRLAQTTFAVKHCSTRVVRQIDVARDGPDDDIPVGDDALNLLAVDDWQHANIAPLHSREPASTSVADGATVTTLVTMTRPFQLQCGVHALAAVPSASCLVGSFSSPMVCSPRPLWWRDRKSSQNSLWLASINPA